jgi:predicted GIY-YIG superfamily endonuclease
MQRRHWRGVWKSHCEAATVCQHGCSFRPNAETALYRHYDEDGRLLYVGISLDVLKRIQQHRGSSWSRDITYIAIEGYASREAAEAAERVAIETERPLYNIAGRLISVVPTAPEVTNGHHS